MRDDKNEPPVGGSGEPTNAELVELVERLRRGEFADEAQEDEAIALLTRSVPHPRVTDLIFQDRVSRTAQEIVDEALAYRPIQL